MSEKIILDGVHRRGMLRHLAAAGAVLMVGPPAPWSPARAAAAPPPDGLSIDAFGADGNGSIDSTEAVARAIRAAAAAGRGVYVPDGRYRVREVRLLNGLRYIEGPGWLVGTSAEPEGVVTTNDGGVPAPLERVRISVNVDCAGIARGGIFCIGLSHSEIRGCRVVGLNANGGNGIRLNFPQFRESHPGQ